jgi:hypothetical protein
VRRTPHASEALRVFVKDLRFGFTGSEAGEDRNSETAVYDRWQIFGAGSLASDAWARQLQRNSERVAWPLRGRRLLEKPPKSVCESGIADPLLVSAGGYSSSSTRSPPKVGRPVQAARPTAFPKCKTRRTRSDGSHYCQHLFREFIPAKRKRQA